MYLTAKRAHCVIGLDTIAQNFYKVLHLFVTRSHRTPIASAAQFEVPECSPGGVHLRKTLNVWGYSCVPGQLHIALTRCSNLPPQGRHSQISQGVKSYFFSHFLSFSPICTIHGSIWLNAGLALWTSGRTPFQSDTVSSSMPHLAESSASEVQSKAAAMLTAIDRPARKHPVMGGLLIRTDLLRVYRPSSSQYLGTVLFEPATNVFL